MKNIIKYENLYIATLNLLKVLMPDINEYLSKSYFKPSYSRVPQLSYNANGFPDIHVSKFSTDTVKHSSCFGKEESKMKIRNYAEYEIFLSEIKKIPKAVSLLGTDKFNEELNNFFYRDWFFQILNAYMYKNNHEIIEDDFCELYILKERLFYLEKYPIDLAIPILFVGFEQDEFEINDGLKVEKMSDEFHYGRMLNKSYVPAIPNILTSGATHCLILKNYMIELYHYILINDIVNNKKSYPIDRINRIFSLISIVTNIETGFAQILMVEKGFALDLDRDYISMKGISLREFPEYFENYHWLNKDLPKVTKKETLEFKILLEKYIKIESNKLDVAIDRYRKCILREHEVDSLIDAIIGMETLLSDNGRGSLTYKLSLKAAALFNEFDIYDDIIKVQSNIKKIYNYRSEVVHGGSKINKKRLIKINNEEKIPAVSLAIEYLKELIIILIENPEFLDSSKIDRKLLLRIEG